jgi:hypothetical protein
MWLSYDQDEVLVFHPEFRTAADAALRTAGLDGRFRWDHHPRMAGVQVIPDFVLVENATNKWWLVVEIKRTRASVFSERNQVQAKGYVEANAIRYPAGRALYFAVCNLEATLLFAANGTAPTRECRIAGMAFDSGNFISTPVAQHKSRLQQDLRTLLEHIVKQPVATFEIVWPRLARSLLARSSGIAFSARIDLSSQTSSQVMRDYFAGGGIEAAPRELLLRCLLAEFLKGVLRRVQHSRAHVLPLLRGDLPSCAAIIDGLRTIDFSGLFETTAGTLYRSVSDDDDLRSPIESYLQELMAERVDDLALRNDTPELTEAIFAEAYPYRIRSNRGKVQTDHDLAQLLCALSINAADEVVLDPGCGDGALLAAAYDGFRVRGRTHTQALSQIYGIEVDSLALKIAALRLVLRDAFAVSPTDPCNLLVGDMFEHRFADTLAAADVILMNPPFKRYEAQDDAPVPPELRVHVKAAIARVAGAVSTDERQANLFNLYVEYVLQSCKPGATCGFILDNRWFHSRNATALRSFLLTHCQIVAIVRYPHDLFFEGFTIATTMLVARKQVAPAEHAVQFVRTNDPRSADFSTVASAIRGQSRYPPNWTCRSEVQASLTSESWQRFFSDALPADVFQEWPGLEDLFYVSRRGSLAKEGGGIVVYEFPFDRRDYGPVRRRKNGSRRPFQTVAGPALSDSQNTSIRSAAVRIPQRYRGYAINNSDQLAGYVLGVPDVTRDETLECPSQRLSSAIRHYRRVERREWDGNLDSAVLELRKQPDVARYIALISRHVKLTERVLSKPEMWNVLREPVAGELIVPRKLRVGHRVHINPFAFDNSGRQVRLSSNFVSYGQCCAVDTDTDLSPKLAVDLIVAFLLSSFGQYQFELYAYNREGVRSIEKHQLSQIKVFDPRWVRRDRRQAIVDAYRVLPFPLPTDRHPETQPLLKRLDELFADEIAARAPGWRGLEADLLRTVWDGLHEWLEARRP